MKKKNAIFLLIDALREDVLSCGDEGVEYMFPNLNRLLRKGFVGPVVTNAQSTQFVLPSLFSQTYPLDYGGYNDGIANRPKSMIECIRDDGYDTYLIATANQLGLSMGYDRGFNHIGTTSDYRTMIEHRITRTLYYVIDQWRKGETSREEAIEVVQTDFTRLIDGVITNFTEHDKTCWSKQLTFHNSQIYKTCIEEKKLLAETPEIVFEKLLRISAGVYWKFLGKKSIGVVSLFVARAIESANWRGRNLVKGITWFPFLTLSHYQALAGEVLPEVSKILSKTTENPKCIYMHIMDAHDCRAVNRPLHVLSRLRYLSKWITGRKRGYTKRRWLYDSALMYIDENLGVLLNDLEQLGQLDETIFLVTGDHASRYAESPRKKLYVGNRTFYEDLNVPILMSGLDKRPTKVGMTDSMGVSASFMKALDVTPHESFKGKSVFGPGRDVIISENCGHGNSDVVRRDLYFTVTTLKAKLMAVLQGNELVVNALFNKEDDPKELVNIVEEDGAKIDIDFLIDCLWKERQELLLMRGWTPENSYTIVGQSVS